MKEQNWKQSIAWFLTAQTISLFGSSLVQYSIIWYITLSTSSGKALTISTLCGFVPQIIVSLFAGVWIDRYSRKKLIILADFMIAAITLALAISFMLGNKNMWLLFAALFVRSLGSGIQNPLVNSTIPLIVPSKNLMKINGINATLSSLTMFLSPLLSGAILTIYGLETTLLIDVITGIIGITITSKIFIKSHTQNTNLSSSITELKLGISYLKNSKLVRNIIVFQLIILFLISPCAFLTPLMVSRTFGPEVWRLTASEMTYSLGMILGGILISSWGGFKNKLNTTLLSGFIYGILMLSLSFAPLFLMYLLFNTMIGITSPCYNAPITSSIQENVQSNMQGRVFSFMQIASSISLPLGMIIWGPLADLIKIQYILFICGLLVCIVTFSFWKTQFSKI